MSKNKKLKYTLALVPLIIIIGLFVWFFSVIFEGEKPAVQIHPLPEYITGPRKFIVVASDIERGLKALKVTVKQEGRETVIFEKRFPFEGLLNREGQHRFEKEVALNPAKLNLSQGRVDLNISAWDYSRRGGGDGNISILNHKMTVDTIPPSIRNISKMHNVNIGGTGLVLYQASSDTKKSGVYVNDIFFPGFPAGGGSRKGIHVCYFALPYNMRSKPTIYLWAQDRAKNQSKNTFYHHILKKRFRKERINVTDRFLDRIIPYFSFYNLEGAESNVEKYVKINNEMRKDNNELLSTFKGKVSGEKLWQGVWLRLKNAATMARFADARSYYYKGKEIDQQVHLGIDLASLANSPVQAANHGKVLYAKKLGIYGETVVLDHGQGLTSLYGHLSQVNVSPGQEVRKGDIVGHTGQTGLAGGDHLHFAVMVNSVPVNPIEWWDGHWIQDNVTKKLALLKE